jgi:superfamily I DNA/RNA helicase
MRANDVEDLFKDALADAGVQLRNAARNVGEIAIQDLLSEELTETLVYLLRLGATARNPEAWGNAQQSLQYLEGIDPRDEAGLARLQERLQHFTRDLRSRMTAMQPDADTAREFAREALEFVGESVIRQGSPAYQRDTDFNRVWNGFNLLLQESSQDATSWTGVLNHFEGIGQVMLMTVHKSKGLEFHTMVFFGLDNRSWWSLNPGNAEELNSFFVAFTRARQRAFFTYCSERGAPVGWIEQILEPVGLSRIYGP